MEKKSRPVRADSIYTLPLNHDRNYPGYSGVFRRRLRTPMFSPRLVPSLVPSRLLHPIKRVT